MFTLDARSLTRLAGVHADLVRVVHKAAEISPIRFIVTEGLRTRERQAELVKSGASQTSNSRHLTGHAVDLAVSHEPGQVSWTWSDYVKLSAFVKDAATELGVAVDWGGDWKSLKDGPHFELDRKVYP